jgi:hypothetical protein
VLLVRGLSLPTADRGTFSPRTFTFTRSTQPRLSGWLPLQHRIPEFPGSNLSLETGHPEDLKLATHVQVGLSVLPAQLCLRQAAGACVGTGTPFSYNCTGGRSKYENSFDQPAGLRTAQAYRSVCKFRPSIQATCLSQSEPAMYFSVLFVYLLWVSLFLCF